MNILWSILICSIPNRYGFDGDSPYAVELLKELHHQTQEFDDVEILMLYDNQKRTTGSKRNELLRMAKGQYLSFIDDDDMVTTDYVKSIRDVLLEKSPDVVVFGLYSRRYENHVLTYESAMHIPDPALSQSPFHTSVWRTSLAQGAVFPDVTFAEDTPWMLQLRPQIHECCMIRKVLYYWNWRSWIDQSRKGTTEEA